MFVRKREFDEVVQSLAYTINISLDMAEDHCDHLEDLDDLLHTLWRAVANLEAVVYGEKPKPTVKKSVRKHPEQPQNISEKKPVAARTATKAVASPNRPKKG